MEDRLEVVAVGSSTNAPWYDALYCGRGPGSPSLSYPAPVIRFHQPVDVVARLGPERDVQISGERMLRADGDDAEVAPLDQLAVEGREPERLVVEGPARGEIRDVDFDVVDTVRS